MKVELVPPESVTEPRLWVRHDQAFAMMLGPGSIEWGSRRSAMEQFDYAEGDLALCDRHQGEWVGLMNTPHLQIGISDATVHIRVRRLIADGLIKKFTISVDNNMLGYDHLAFMGINIEPGFADEVTEGLLKIDEVLEIHEMHGRFDLILKIRAKDLDQMREIVVNKIRKLPRILETELMTVLKTRKEDQLVSLKKEVHDIPGTQFEA